MDLDIVQWADNIADKNEQCHAASIIRISEN
jgi:hypothetical protein